jgi:hypothetical protein
LCLSGTHAKIVAEIEGDRGVLTGDIIAAIGAVIALIAWLFPRAPKSKKTEGPNVETISAKETPEETIIDIPFPAGLYLLDYEPGVRLSIRENKKTPLISLMMIPAFFLGSIALAVSVSAEAWPLGAFVLIWLVAYAIRRTRLGTVVHLNLKKRMYFVSNPGGAWGGGWPPDVAIRVELDTSTSLWVTSLYLATVRIWTASTVNPGDGKRKIKPFLEALQKIKALKPTNATVLDSLIEYLQI